MLLRHVLFHEIKRKIGHQLPAQVMLAALLLATFFAKKQALHVMQNLNANQNLIFVFFVLFAIFILHSRESELYRYTLDGKSALAWELPFSRFMGHLSST